MCKNEGETTTLYLITEEEVFLCVKMKGKQQP